MPSYGTIDHEYGRNTTDPADDGPVWMVNLMKYKEVADYGDGADSGRSGRDADDEYTPTGPLKAVGAEIVYVAEVDATPLGDGTHGTACVVKYPTRRSFIEMQQRSDFKDKHVTRKPAGDHLRDRLSADGDRHEQAGKRQLLGRRRASSDDEDGVCTSSTSSSGTGRRERMEGYHDAAFDVHRNTARMVRGRRDDRW